jgi:hypothetical protein
MKSLSKLLGILLLVVILASAAASPAKANPGVGDQVHQLTVPISGVDTYCSIGLAFDGQFLYYDRCSDQNIYKIDPVSGDLKDTFSSGINEFPNALAYDRTRNGIWIGAQRCNIFGMPIYFWDLDDDSVTQAFTIPNNLTNPASGQLFLRECFTDGLAFDANDPTEPNDDEIWFGDDVNPNIGVFRPDGVFLRGYDATSIDPSLDRASGLAIGGQFLYVANDGGGDVFRADKAKNPLELVDQFTSGDTRQEDMECDPVTFSPKEVMWVRTTPQGGEFPDVITAYEIELGSCGAGGAPVDSDGDGLYDGWETEGVTIDPDGAGPLPPQFIDLPAMHANKDVRDIFVHMDWMFANNHNHQIQLTAIKLVVDAFDRRGIKLHVDQGPDSTLDFISGEKWAGLSRAGAIPEVYELDVNGTLNSFNWNGFQSLKDRPGGFKDSGRSPIFHYILSAHQLFTISGPLGDPCGPSGISRGIPASDFILALGGWYVNETGHDDCEVKPDSTYTGTLAQQAGTFMHELGHNLGLRHGGGDNIHNKPNYLSVMNYSFQMNGLLASGKILQFDYSDTELPVLDEKYLLEELGIQGGDRYKDYRTLYFCGDPEMKVADANGPIDWNCDNDKTYVGLSIDINGDKLCIGPGTNAILESTPSEDDIIVETIIKNGANGICESTPTGDDERLSSLVGYNDWANLKFDGGLIGLGTTVKDLPMNTSAQEITPFETAHIPPAGPVLPIVNIDIKPGSDLNPINLKSKGKIPVAILSTTIFNASTQVDKTSLTFGRTGDEMSLAHCNNTTEDVNGDGLFDQVCHFYTQLTGFVLGSTAGVLKGKTLNGVTITGQDSVQILK